MPNIYIYGLADISGPPDVLATGGVMSVQAGAAPDLAVISDEDGFLNASFLGTSIDQNQVLAQDLTIDGQAVGSMGDQIYIGADATVTKINDPTAPESTFSAIFVDGQPVGFVSLIELTPGDVFNVGTPELLFPSDQPYAGLVPCFTRDTRILCETGPVPVQHLRVGDKVVSRDHGLQVVRWVGSQKTAGHGPLAPVMFRKGALGTTRDLLVSPMHRMLITGPRAEVLFGVPELLAHAKDLRDGDSIFSAPCDEVEYFHVLFDTHQIIHAHGCWSESFAPQHAVLDGYARKTRNELLTLFPRLQHGWKDARPTAAAHEAALFMAR